MVIKDGFPIEKAGGRLEYVVYKVRGGRWGTKGSRGALVGTDKPALGVREVREVATSQPLYVPLPADGPFRYGRPPSGSGLRALRSPSRRNANSDSPLPFKPI